MSSEFGKLLRVSLFGESHGAAVGFLMDGLPAGEIVDLDELQAFLDRRRPRGDGLSTARSEADIPRFLSGLHHGRTCGFPLCAVMENRDRRPEDYNPFRDTPRPGHADFTAFAKWKGFADMRGGGHFSGRLTAPLCAAGGIAKQILARRGVFIGAHLHAAGGVEDAPFPLLPTPELFAETAAKPFPVLDDEAGARMRAAIAAAREERDSVGGVVECAAAGLPAGLGGPLFDGLESRLAAAVFGIPAVKGVEFGEGFRAAALRGSENNDAFIIRADGCTSANNDAFITQAGGDTLANNDSASSNAFTTQAGGIVTEANHSGGILGGISNGMPLVFRAAFKPAPSIGRVQKTVRLSDMEETTLSVGGRHDPCVAHRAVPVVEAVTACVLLDVLLESGAASV